MILFSFALNEQGLNMRTLVFCCLLWLPGIIQAQTRYVYSIEKMTDGGVIAMPDSVQQRLIAQDTLWKEALRIHFNAIVMDGHIDTPSLILDEGYDIGKRHVPERNRAHVDLPRMYEGGLDAPFFSIYVSTSYGEGPEAPQRARAMIAALKQQVARYADSIAMAYSAADVRRITRSGKKAALMGLEGGHALMRSPDTLRALYRQGIRYVTLTHTASHSWADASQDVPRWQGLSLKGEELVREMNRIGMIIDISHVSDSTFFDVIALSKAPVIASHSSVRALVNNVRNLSDEQLDALARNGGVVMINFFDAMVNPHLTPEVMNEVYRRINEQYGGDLQKIWQVIREVVRERNIPPATVEDVVNHIDYVAQRIGVEHVGLGSDFDGVSSLPRGLEDVTRLPWITYYLLKRGYSEEDIYKILGGNTLRVLDQVENIARMYQQKTDK